MGAQHVARVDSSNVYVHQLPTHFCWTNRSNLETQKVQKHHQLMNTSGCAVTFYFLPPSCYQNLFQESCLWKKNASCILLTGFQISPAPSLFPKHQLASLNSRVIIGIKYFNDSGMLTDLEALPILEVSENVATLHMLCITSQISHTDWLQSMNLFF